MAVRSERAIHRYVGLSTDRKPTPYALGGNMGDTEPLPPGSVWYEVDTGLEARWDGGKWLYQPSLKVTLDQINRTLESILDLLQKRAEG